MFKAHRFCVSLKLGVRVIKELFDDGCVGAFVDPAEKHLLRESARRLGRDRARGGTGMPRS